VAADWFARAAAQDDAASRFNLGVLYARGLGVPRDDEEAIFFLSTATIIAGDPESCIKTIKTYEDIGVDQVMLIMQTETIPHDKVMESIELYGKEVIPAFRNGGNGK